MPLTHATQAPGSQVTMPLAPGCVYRPSQRHRASDESEHSTALKLPGVRLKPNMFRLVTAGSWPRFSRPTFLLLLLGLQPVWCQVQEANFCSGATFHTGVKYYRPNCQTNTVTSKQTNSRLANCDRPAGELLEKSPCEKAGFVGAYKHYNGGVETYTIHATPAGGGNLKYDYKLKGYGRCVARKFYLEFSQDHRSLLPSSHPLHSTDRIRECMNLCVAAGAAEPDKHSMQQFTIQSSPARCRCTVPGDCQYLAEDEYIWSRNLVFNVNKATDTPFWQSFVNCKDGVTLGRVPEVVKKTATVVGVRTFPNTFRNSTLPIRHGTFTRDFVALKVIVFDTQTGKVSGSVSVEPGAFEEGLNIAAIIFPIHAGIAGPLHSGTFAGLPKLEYVNLKKGALTEIKTRAFSDLPKCWFIDLSYNKLTKVAVDAFYHVLHYTDSRCYTSKNCVKEHMDPIVNSQGFTRFRPDIGNSEQTPEVRLNNNLLASLEPGAFHGLVNTKSLDLGSNVITQLLAGTFAGLGSLTSLTLSDNHITYVETGTFAGLAALVFVGLANNRITSAGRGAFEGLVALEIADMANNPVLFTVTKPNADSSALATVARATKIQAIAVTGCSAGRQRFPFLPGSPDSRSFGMPTSIRLQHPSYPNNYMHNAGGWPCCDAGSRKREFKRNNRKNTWPALVIDSATLQVATWDETYAQRTYGMVSTTAGPDVYTDSPFTMMSRCNAANSALDLRGTPFTLDHLRYFYWGVRPQLQLTCEDPATGKFVLSSTGNHQVCAGDTHACVSERAPPRGSQRCEARFSGCPGNAHPNLPAELTSGNVQASGETIQLAIGNMAQYLAEYRRGLHLCNEVGNIAEVCEHSRLVCEAVFKIEPVQMERSQCWDDHTRDCTDGAVRTVDTSRQPVSALNTAATPEVFFSGQWYPICGESFWNNNAGASEVCTRLGFASGRVQTRNADGSTDESEVAKGRTQYSQDAMPVGQCGAGQALQSCTNGGNAWGKLDYREGLCRRGQNVGVKVVCTGGSGQRTANCGRDTGTGKNVSAVGLCTRSSVSIGRVTKAICTNTPAICETYMQKSNTITTCRQYCAASGLRCVAMYDDNNSCSRGSKYSSCDETGGSTSDHICRCSRVPDVHPCPQVDQSCEFKCESHGLACYGGWSPTTSLQKKGTSCACMHAPPRFAVPQDCVLSRRLCAAA